jgi:O-acetyl-ADP-ribose deacetylase (regulator of RNase III)
MPFEIVRNDITKMHVDAIVNAANETLLGGGGVDGAIHRAAGIELLDECRRLGGCKTGEAKITKGYKLPAKYVIHTVGPIFRGNRDSEKLLRSCYRESLALAKKYNCESIAFPLISSGAYGYPKAEALKVAIDVISDFLLENDMKVYVVIFDKFAYTIGVQLFRAIAEYIDDNYVDERYDYRFESRRASHYANISAPPDPIYRDELTYHRPVSSCDGEESLSLSSLDGYDSMEFIAKPKPEEKIEEQREKESEIMAHISSRTLFFYYSSSSISPEDDLRAKLKKLDESFSEMLLRKIDEKGITDSECYKKANIDRKLFSKIRSDMHYKPSKPTVIAFAIALELSLEETNDMLRKAGFALSHSNKFDIIIEYFIINGIYNIYEINQALFAFDQSLLGG